MKKLSIFGVVTLFMSLFLSTNVALAGDCTKRDKVDWQGTISAAVYVRVDCPSGDIIGTAPAGERVSIKEVDLHGDFYLVESSVGSGFIYKSYLKDIVESPLSSESDIVSEPVRYEGSIFWDLKPDHKYYDYIADVKAKGIVDGNPDGSVEADGKINRAALAKILVEASVDSEVIDKAYLSAGTYSDVDIKAWYAPYLKVAKELGIVTGDAGETTVRPGDGANGAEVAKMVAVAFDMEVREKKAWEEWYAPYFESLGEINALPYSKGSHEVTRAEMMYMVSVVLNSQGNDL